MLYLLLILLIVLNIIWLLPVLFGLPGNWLIVISTCLFAWWRWEDSIFSIYTLTAILFLTILGEFFEFLGITVKTIIGIIILFTVAIATFWP
jgi:hypothetical protein